MTGGIPTSDDDRTLFEAVILPHRSLSARGRGLLLGALAVALVLDSMVFAAIGAWPVGGFAGAELLLAILLFRWHARAAQAQELILLSAAGLRIVRIDHTGRRQETTLPTGWLTVQVEERRGRAAEVVLVGHGHRVAVGVSLGEVERRDLAVALATALHDLRHPRFDNAVLRDPPVHSG